MSKQLDEINAALHSYRVLLSVDIKHSKERWRRWRKAAELVSLTFEIEKLAKQLDEEFKQLDDIQIPGMYNDKLAISDLISLIESQQPGTAIHPATKLPLEETPSFLIAKKWLSQSNSDEKPVQKVKGAQRVFDVPTPDAELYEHFSPENAIYKILMLILKSGAGDIEVNSAQGRVKLSQHYYVVSADRWQYEESLKNGN